MSTARFRSPLRRIFEEGFNHGNLAVVDEVFAAEYVAHAVRNGASNGPQGVKWWIAMLRSAFPDLHCTVEDEISDGDHFATRWIMRGTQDGMFLGNQPTGRPVEVQGIAIARMQDGRIIEDWALIDQMGILQQIGVVPPVS